MRVNFKNRPNKRITSVLLVLLVGIVNVSCFSKSKASQASNKLSLDSDEDYFDKVDDNKKMLHPDQPNASSTRNLILTNPQPSEQELATCKTTVEALAEMASPTKSLGEDQQLILDKINSKPFVYHWCFYQIAAQMDRTLQSDMEQGDRSEAFLKYIGQLLVLGKALSSSENEYIYCKYTQTRYIELSKEYFGRDLQMTSQDSCGL